MRAPRIDSILARDDRLQSLLAKARDLRALSLLVDRFLPAELARQARVANCREGHLVLAAASAAAAAKLRVLGPSLNRYLAEQRWQVSSVQVRVQPNTSQTDKDAAPQKSAMFSAATLDSLKTLYLGMTSSPARDALGALLERRGAKPAGKR